jgi:hypothetical protein
MTSEKPPKRRVLRDDEGLQPLGSVRVIVDEYPHLAECRVYLDRACWGLSDVDRVFIGHTFEKAHRYAEQLFAQLQERAAGRVRYRLERKARNAFGREAGIPSALMGRVR